jgi:mannose/fructose-specific phosphotransferase system component IIA
VAVTVTEADDVTALVATVNVAVLLPATTVTEAGTVAEALLLERETAAPPVGAAALKVRVPVTDVPPVTLAGFTLTDDRATLVAGVIVSAAVLLTPLQVAVRVAETEDVTELVATVNVAVVLPAATVTVAGTVAEALLLASETKIPPVGAAAPTVTVPVTEVPPVTLVGLTLIEESATVAAGVMVSAAVLLTPL